VGNALSLICNLRLYFFIGSPEYPASTARGKSGERKTILFNIGVYFYYYTRNTVVICFAWLVVLSSKERKYINKSIRIESSDVGMGESGGGGRSHTSAKAEQLPPQAPIRWQTRVFMGLGPSTPKSYTPHTKRDPFSLLHSPHSMV
jgi:hypothetical protein